MYPAAERDCNSRLRLSLWVRFRDQHRRIIGRQRNPDAGEVRAPSLADEETGELRRGNRRTAGTAIVTRTAGERESAPGMPRVRGRAGARLGLTAG